MRFSIGRMGPTLRILAVLASVLGVFDSANNLLSDFTLTSASGATFIAEPATAALLATGSALLGLGRRRLSWS